MGGIYSHRRSTWMSVPAFSALPTKSRKKTLGSTRCAASCGQAYTQLGSACSVHRSQDVAFFFTTAICRPGACGSSCITSNECILMLPYGQFRAHSPQPMHQSSMMTSFDSRLPMAATGQPIMHNGSRQERQDV